MRIRASMAVRATLLISLMVGTTALSTRLQADTGICGGASITLPFTDVPAGNVFFCSIAEAFFSGLSNGTSGTTYGPGNNVTREQMAAFVTRTMDQSVKRGSRRAALKQFWTPSSVDGLGLTAVGSAPELVESDGTDLWVTDDFNGSVSRVRASDGKLLETWFGAPNAYGVLAAKGLIWLTGFRNPGKLYVVDPTLPVGNATTLNISLGDFPRALAFDGARIWTANQGGSVSIVTLNPLSVNTVTTGFTTPFGILYDGANMWVTDATANTLLKLDSNGAIIQTVTMDPSPVYPVFDGTNIWVPNAGANTVTVVRASTGTVVARLGGNGLSIPRIAAFDGERILVTNLSVTSVSLWTAADLTPLGSVSFSSATNSALGACSDGLNFWITLRGTEKLARF